METPTSSALVIWGSTGKRLQFTRHDLQMPELLREKPNYHFFEKQWDAVAGFWMNRVLKEAGLQHMTVSDIVQCIVGDIEKRWEHRKREKALYKKRKRLLNPSGTTAAGKPSPHVLLTNIVSLHTYRQLGSEDALREIISAVLEKVEEVAKEKAISHTILVDDPKELGKEAEKQEDETRNGDGESDAQATKKRKLDDGSEAIFDDHVALVCTFSSQEVASNVVAELHGSKFDSRTVLCRFYDL